MQGGDGFKVTVFKRTDDARVGGFWRFAPRRSPHDGCPAAKICDGSCERRTQGNDPRARVGTGPN